MKQIIKLAVTLAAFSVICCGALAGVYLATESKIAAAVQAELQAALQHVFPNAEFTDVSSQFAGKNGSVTIENVYTATTDGTFAGTVIKATGPTFDTTSLVVGFSTNGTITGVRIQKTGDTPGFGLLSTEPAFYEQFAGTAVTGTITAGETFDGISGATITSNGIAAILQTAYDTAVRVQSENK